jgi:hypothetical protein
MNRKRILMAAVLTPAAALLWLFAARPVVLGLDRLGTHRIAMLPIENLAFDSGSLLVGPTMLDLTTPDYGQAGSLRLDAPDRLVLSSSGRDFVLGRKSGTRRIEDKEVPEFALESGDEAVLTWERSRFAWPTPFDFNFMTGHSPSWRRANYRRLEWKKASGARLDIVWRFEDYFYPSWGWVHSEMTREDWSGLAELTITPSRSVAAGSK